MKVIIPSPLYSYTQAREIEAEGDTLAEVLRDLDRRYPGIRFRVIDEQDQLRPHMRIGINGTLTRDLSTPLSPTDELQILQALSGG